MSDDDKYGFGGGISLPSSKPVPEKKRDPVASLEKAVEAGTELGFVNRDPVERRRPGPRRKEAQDKVSIPGPKRVTDRFRNICRKHDTTLWEGLEMLMNESGL